MSTEEKKVIVEQSIDVAGISIATGRYEKEYMVSVTCAGVTHMLTSRRRLEGTNMAAMLRHMLEKFA